MSKHSLCDFVPADLRNIGHPQTELPTISSNWALAFASTPIGARVSSRGRDLVAQVASAASLS